MELVCRLSQKRIRSKSEARKVRSEYGMGSFEKTTEKKFNKAFNHNEMVRFFQYKVKKSYVGEGIFVSPAVISRKSDGIVKSPQTPWS